MCFDGCVVVVTAVIVVEQPSKKILVALGKMKGEIFAFLLLN